MKYILVLSLCFSFQTLYAQNNEAHEPTTHIDAEWGKTWDAARFDITTLSTTKEGEFEIVTKGNLATKSDIYGPRFNGSITDYMKENYHYPEEAKAKGIEGTVVLFFDVETDGSITNIRTISKNAHPLLIEETERLIKNMPRWQPRKTSQKDETLVKSMAALSVPFKLFQ